MGIAIVCPCLICVVFTYSHATCVVCRCCLQVLIHSHVDPVCGTRAYEGLTREVHQGDFSALPACQVHRLKPTPTDLSRPHACSHTRISHAIPALPNLTHTHASIGDRFNRLTPTTDMCCSRLDLCFRRHQQSRSSRMQLVQQGARQGSYVDGKCW